MFAHQYHFRKENNKDMEKNINVQEMLNISLA